MTLIDTSKLFSVTTRDSLLLYYVDDYVMHTKCKIRGVVVGEVVMTGKENRDVIFLCTETLCITLSASHFPAGHALLKINT